jgi:uncharacterized protein
MRLIPTNSNSNLRVAACLPFGKTCCFVSNGRAALNWNPFQPSLPAAFQWFMDRAGRDNRQKGESPSMRVPFAIPLVVLSLLTLGGRSAAAEDASPKKIRVLATVGGHDYEKEPFDAMFAAMPDLEVTQAVMPEAIDILRPGLENKYDVLVRYDIVRNLTEQQKQAFVDLMRSGIGLVSLHHNLCVQDSWPEYFDVIGTTMDKTWQEGLDMRIFVVDKEHPVTRGVHDFVIHDEAYNGYRVASNVHVLLRTDHPKNSPAEIAWTTRYGRSPVVYLMLGHDGAAYQNPAYRTLVHNAIAWTAKEPKTESTPQPAVKNQ